MAKNSTKTNKALKKDRKKDFHQTNDINAALFGNLSKQIKKSQKKLQAKDARILERINHAMANIERQGKREVRKLDQRESRTGNADGMLSGVYTAGRKGVVAETNSGIRAAEAGQKMAYTQGNAAQQLLNIAKQGVKEAEAGAQYATAQALTYRAQQDAQFVASLKEAEANRAFQAEQAQKDRDHAEKMLKLQYRAADEQAKKERRETEWNPLRQAITQATQLNADISKFYSDPTFQENAQTLANETGVPVEDAMKQLLTAQLQETVAGTPEMGAMANALVNGVIQNGGMGSFDGMRTAVLGYVTTTDPSGTVLRFAQDHENMVDRLLDKSFHATIGPYAADISANLTVPAEDSDESGPIGIGVPIDAALNSDFVQEGLLGTLPESWRNTLTGFLNPFG